MPAPSPDAQARPGSSPANPLIPGPLLGSPSGQPGPNATGTAMPATTMKDIHDILPPEPAGVDGTMMSWVLGGLLILLALGLAVLAWRRRRIKLRAALSPALPPDRAALAALRELTDVDRFEGKIFYFRLSAVLRRYLGERFGVSAPEMTIEELLPALDQLETLPEALPPGPGTTNAAAPALPVKLSIREWSRPLRELFTEVGPILYADAPASVARMESHLDLVMRFVEKTASLQPSFMPDDA